MIQPRGVVPAGPAVPPARLRSRLRRGGVRPGAPRLRRSSRPALPPAAHHRARVGAVDVESGLVGGLSGDAVLSARLLLSRRAGRSGLLRPRRRRCHLSDAPLANLVAARLLPLLASRAPPPKTLI